MVDSNVELVLITCAVLVVLYSAGFLIVSRMNNAKNIGPFFHYMQPILPSEPSAVRLRLDAALLDAEGGFHACSVCDFENLKRNIFCSLCGSILKDTAAEQQQHEPHNEGKDKLYAQRQRMSASRNHHRKARALKRKEWVRKVDVEGKLYWFRNASRVGSGAQPHHGYVVQFDGEPLVELVAEETPGTAASETEPLLTRGAEESGATAAAPAADVEEEVDVISDKKKDARASVVDVPAPDDTREGEGHEVIPPPRVKCRLVRRSLEETHRLMESELLTRPLMLVDSTAAHPSRPAVVIHTGAVFSEDPTKLVANSSLDFPSKIAEFVARTSTAVMVGEQSFLKVNIHRDKLLQNSIEALATMPANHARCPMRMAFVGEQGIDAGGVYREWLELVSQQLVAANAGIFRCVDARDRTFYLNPTSDHDIGDHHLAHIFATGRLLGRMLLEGNVTGFHVALPLLKIIVGQPVTLSDLEYFDAESYKSLLWLLANDGVDALGLDFTVTEQTAKGEAIAVELIPNGRQVEVTDTNKHAYVDCKLKYLLFESVQHQLFAFLKGLYEVMPPELLMLFDAEELDFVLSGSDEIDVDDWERNTKSTIDLMDHPVLEWFWDVVREMPNEYRRRLLLFATGSSRVPLAGFASLTSYDGRLCPFTLKGVDMDYEGGYIRSHACFNQLDLPRYYKKDALKAVLYAVLDTDLYGFTSV